MTVLTLEILGLFILVGGITHYATKRLMSQKLNSAIDLIQKSFDSNSTGKFSTKDPALKSLNRLARIFSERTAQRSRETLQESGKASVILENMEEGVIAVDSRSRILVFNLGAEQIFEIPAEKAMSKTVLEVVRSNQMVELFDRAIDAGSKLTETLEITHPVNRFLKIYAAGVSRPGTEICGILVFSDVSDVKRLENLRRDFVANVSHELKTPLTSIKGFAETLLGGSMKSAEQTKSFLKLMSDDADRLERLINNLLDLSKIESKGVSLETQKINFHEEVEQVLANFEQQIKNKNILVENRIWPAMEAKLRVDRDQLRQVLINLIDNAIKFNVDEGKISIEAEKDSAFLTILIKDSGIGISEEDQKRVFERFYRVDKARSRKSGGTGLGLSIAKHIVESHSGKLACTSVLEQGSTFRLTLPIESIA